MMFRYNMSGVTLVFDVGVETALLISVVLDSPDGTIGLV